MEQGKKEHKRRVRYSGTHPKRFEEKYKELNPEKYKETVDKIIGKGNTPAGMHIPIMVQEIIDFLQIKKGQKGLDATLGYGGHSSAMLKELQGQGHLYALDIDPIEIKKTIPPKHAAQTAGANTGGTEGKDIKEGGFIEGDSVLGYIHKDGHRGKGPHQDSYPVDQESDGKSGSLKMQDIKPQKLRIMCMDKNAGKYVVMFIPDADGTNGVIKFELSAETGSYPAPLVSASLIGQGGVRVSGNKLAGVEFKKDSPLKVMLQLDYSDYCSMEVSACADKK